MNAEQKINFRNWFRSTPSDQIKALRERIITECVLNRDHKQQCPVLYNWLTGTTEVPPLAQKVINEIAGQELDYSLPEVPERINKNKPVNHYST